MIPCNINLYILLYNKDTLEYNILSTKENKLQTPKISVELSCSINDLLKKIFENHIDMDAFFTHFVIGDILITKDSLDLCYYTLIQYNTKIKDGFLLPIKYNEISSPALQKILSKL